MTNSKGLRFEDEVRELCRNKWDLRPSEGGAEFIASHEIDCVCRTDEVTHLVMCTTSKTLKKAKEDVRKLLVARDKLQRTGDTVKLWFVTKSTPTPDQRAEARPKGVTAVSSADFRRSLFDARRYLEARNTYSFGSALDPENDSPSLPSDEYVPLPMIGIENSEEHSIHTLIENLIGGKSVVLTGPFGAGKSITIATLFRRLRSLYLKGKIDRVPVAINLREHWGQTSVAEVFVRHANNLGIDKSFQFVRALNTGQLLLMLDGFDEVTTQSWRIGKQGMQMNRRAAVELIRNFTKITRGNSGILIAGRDHYFDNIGEMRSALGLSNDYLEVRLEEFSEEQASQYLKKKGFSVELPHWLPRKPLLLGYLASRNLLEEVLAIDDTGGIAHAWDTFIDRICIRESELSGSIYPQAVRQLLEALATKTRESDSGTGPLLESYMADAYEAVTGDEPLESARTLLGRLPGLTSRDQEAGTRSFVDVDMLDALRGGNVSTYAASPFSKMPLKAIPWRHALGELGCAVATLKAQQWKMKPSQFVVATEQAIARWNEPTLGIDCAIVGSHLMGGNAIDMLGNAVSDGFASVIDLDARPIQNFTLTNCYIEHITLSNNTPHNLLLSGCMIHRLEGASGEIGLPDWIVKSVVEVFDDVRTPSAIMQLNIPAAQKVLLTILHKLFERSGKGRIEGALTRGLAQENLKHVGSVLDLLDSHGIAFKLAISGRTPVWHPRRNQAARVGAIMATPGAIDDPLVTDVRNL